MARMISKAKTSRVNRATTSAPSDTPAYCRDLDNWPRSWMGLEKDLPPGEQLLACFRPFIEHLASSSLSPKTIRKHVDNLWTLGGEIIRDLNEDPSLRKVAAGRLLIMRRLATAAQDAILPHIGCHLITRSSMVSCSRWSRRSCRTCSSFRCAS
jgi:hypothetical protein